jgi:hypothetical protein
MNRRTFLHSTGAVATALTIVPRHVLGGAGQIAPSEKITIALIGCGSQGIREMAGELKAPELQFVAACDPNKDGTDYVDWSKDATRQTVAEAIGNPDWRKGAPGIPGGREVGKIMIEGAYARQRNATAYKGCNVYNDFRELLEKEKDLNAVKVMTPDHWHAAVSVAAMKQGKRVLLHKPLANRVSEARWVIETARRTKVATHFLPANSGQAVPALVQWVKSGAIGRLREIHNWSNRPVWPQYTTLPTDTPPVPKDFDWDLWLGPCAMRPYHPHYTHAVFRGWYDFGGGPIADMGHYSLWRVFLGFDLDAPIAVESTPSHVCEVKDSVSRKIHNDFSFPIASTVRFKFAAKGARPAVDLFWYDGGIRPRTPEELEKENKELDLEGMMLVGDEGIILADFLGNNPRLLPRPGGKNIPLPKVESPPSRSWIQSFRGGPATDGNFLLAGPISEAFNLAAISLRMGGKRLLWDSAAQKITNRPEAAKYLTREYRKGWEPEVG